ncbi:MAG TPA: WG repeat-containing protein, partial [Roseivirga sp.]
IYNAHGQKLTDFQFEAIIPISDQLYLISKYNHQGLLNKQLQMIVPPLYKSLNLSSDQAQALAYDQWDYYSENTYSATYYYDEVGFTDEPTFVTLSDTKTGIINLQDEHLLFLPNESYHDGNEEIFVTQNKSSGRFRVYSSHGRNLFRDSFDEVVLFEEIFFAKTNQPDEHAWSVYNFSGKKLNLSNYQSFNRRSPLFFEVKQNDKLGLIGSNGQEVSPFLYDELSQFSNGRAIALYNEGYGVINENGIWIMTPYHDSLTILDEAIYFKQGSEYGVADLFGKVKYRSQEHFEMYSNVIIRTEEDSTLALYNLEDERLLEPSYQSIRKLNDDLLLLHRDKKSFIYRLSDRADFKLDPAVIEIGNLVNGFIPIRKDDQWGFLNVEGRLVIANRYEAVQDFSEGYFPVKLIGKWGFVNDNEELVIQPNFDSVEPFKNSLSIVKSNGKYGLINPKGSFELEMNFDGIERYGKYFLIELNGLIGLADANGKILKNPSYDAIQLLDQNYFLVKRNGNFGVIDLDGNDIMPTNYIEIKQSGTRFLGKKPGEHRTFKIQ